MSPQHPHRKRLRRRVVHPLRRTTRAIGFTVRRWDGFVVTVVAAGVYLLSYLWATDHLQFREDAGFNWLVVNDPTARLLERRGPLSFEPVAFLEFGIGSLLFSPIDAAIGTLLATLVGLNLALAYLALVQPKACGIGAGAGAAASVPALLSGSVCCAPMILLVLGIQASGTLLTVIPWLLPVGVALLAGSLLYVSGLVDLSSGRSDAAT